eukprot:gnl/MRDRNA2_/MRDRNA2_120829_c0_seq1.p1 gnl/MRDRNA2_/MRDRNA2_120829_c0~~gnl/MRDRNA2_/MRDRNA2_120829_c0_seq1.p1  ORF type:complete len:620 (-),score=147.85 gnl/MRDRNA2_/MRDRNA2_120829_c0_seq1:115-1974(-)
MAEADSSCMMRCAREGAASEDPENLLQQASMHFEQVVERRMSEAEKRLEQNIGQLLRQVEMKLLDAMSQNTGMQNNIYLNQERLATAVVVQNGVSVSSDPSTSYQRHEAAIQPEPREVLHLMDTPKEAEMKANPVLSKDLHRMDKPNDSEMKGNPVLTKDVQEDFTEMPSPKVDYGKLAEFLKAAKDRRSKSQHFEVDKATRERISNLFDELDTDKDGFLSTRELSAGMSNGCLGAIDEEQVKSIVVHAAKHADRDDSGLLDIDEFKGLFLVDKPNFIDRHHRKIQYFLTLLYFVLAPCVYIPFNPFEDGSHWSTWDALYFSAVTVTTVGYGDFSPSNDNMRIFTVFYILFGLTIVASVVNDCVQAFVNMYDAKMKQFNAMVMAGIKDTANKAVETIGMDEDNLLDSQGARNAVNKAKDKLDIGMLKKLWFSFLLFATPVLVGTIFFAINEDWSYIRSFYWSVVTCTTVGYGDMTLEQQSSRTFSFFYILFGFGFVAAAIGNVGAIQMERVLEKKKRDFLRTTLSLDLLEDLDHDGQTGVDRCEFLCAMLLQLGKCSEEDLLLILAKFEELDLDKSGQLTKEDLKLMRQKKVHKNKKLPLGQSQESLTLTVVDSSQKKL